MSVSAKCQDGFTLAELLVALAIGGLLFSVAIPSYVGFTKNSRQVSSANELLASLHAARDLAITRNVRVTVCTSAGGTNCEAVSWDDGWIVFLDQDGDQSVDVGETIERVGEELGALNLASSQFGSFIIYRPNGRIMVNTVQENIGEFAFCDDRGSSHARALVIGMSGRPRVSKYNAAGNQPSCS
jgi:type IV fimbrial biogenesis protein FimT